jgi:hypothetical protein
MNYKKVARSYLRNLYNGVRDTLSQDQDLLRNRELKDKYKGKRLFILGSGGSIKLHDLNKLKDEYVMTQNNFHVHEDILTINPAFHCIVPYYQTESDISTWVTWITDIKNKLPNAQFFWGKNTKQMIEENFKELIDRSYYVDAKYNLLTLSKAKADISKRMMVVHTVLTQCLIVAMYMGFSEIYLLGFDLDQNFQNAKNDFGRFYGKSMITDTETERGLERQMHEESVDEWFAQWITFKQLKLIKDYAIANHIKIFNASDHGILNLYSRVNFDKILAKEL